MKKKSGVKYLAPGADKYQPGSHGRVLRNLRGITSVRQMNREELAGYMSAERSLIGTFTRNKRLTVNDIHRIHRWFLGGIYPWAGRMRSVNISKGGFTFAAAHALPQLLQVFESDTLAVNTPCRGSSLDEIARKIATVHTEFLLMHPYREGNGRTARLVATLMAYQADLPGIDFSFIRSRGRAFDDYVVAIQKGMQRDYNPMTALVLRALRRALRSASAVS